MKQMKFNPADPNNKKSDNSKYLPGINPEAAKAAREDARKFSVIDLYLSNEKLSKMASDDVKRYWTVREFGLQWGGSNEQSDLRKRRKAFRLIYERNPKMLSQTGDDRMMEAIFFFWKIADGEPLTAVSRFHAWVRDSDPHY